jgi:hypothetical protein
MKKLLLAIVVGFLINAVFGTAIDHLFHITNVYPPYGEPMRNHALLLLAFSYRAVLMVLSGYFAAIIAKAKQAVLILGTIGSVLWLLGALAMWDFAYPWYNVIGVLLAVPLTFVGWLMYQNRRNMVRFAPSSHRHD